MQIDGMYEWTCFVILQNRQLIIAFNIQRTQLLVVLATIISSVHFAAICKVPKVSVVVDVGLVSWSALLLCQYKNVLKSGDEMWHNWTKSMPKVVAVTYLLLYSIIELV